MDPLSLFTDFDVVSWLLAHLDWVAVALSAAHIYLLVYKKNIRSPDDRRRRAVPGLCLSWGMFYTFAGVAAALFMISKDHSISSMFSLIGGLQVAFVSSVIGMFLSNVAKAKLIDIEIKNAPRELTAEKLNNDLQARHSQLIEVIQQAGGVISRDVSKTLSSSVQASITTVTDEMHHAASTFKHACEALSLAQQQQSESFQSINRETRLLLDDIKQHIHALSTSVTPFHTFIQDNLTWFESQTEGLHHLASVKQQADDALNTQMALLKNYDDLAKRIEETCRSHEDSVLAHTSKNTNNIIETMQILDVDLKAHMEKQQHAIEEVSHQYTQTLSKVFSETCHESLELMGESLLTIAKSFVEHYELELKKQQEAITSFQSTISSTLSAPTAS